MRTAKSLVIAGTTEARTHTSGQLASFALTHWVGPDPAVQLSTGVLNADVYASVGASIGFGFAWGGR